jgi:hypothetical protein
MNTKKDSEQNYHPGIGTDLGTMNILSARRGVDGQVRIKNIRDAFLDLDQDAKRSLKMSHVDYVEKNGTLIVIGDSALTMANLFKREARRPLSKGVISSGEIDAQEILSLLVGHVMGKPSVEDEHCFYSVPAAPIDDPAQDIVYHREIFRRIITEHGYTAHPANEAMAIIYSQCAAENFSGVSLSYGAGMTNVALAYQATKCAEFSLARGGDYIDSQAAKALGRTSAQMCAIKERGLNLVKPKGREQEALALYLRTLIDYSLENIAAQFGKVRNEVALLEPIPLVISGGTSKVEGFVDVFKQQFGTIKKKGFPIEISDIRPASNPMTAVAEGLLVLAIEEHEEA